MVAKHVIQLDLVISDSLCLFSHGKRANRLRKLLGMRSARQTLPEVGLKQLQWSEGRKQNGNDANQTALRKTKPHAVVICCGRYCSTITTTLRCRCDLPKHTARHFSKCLRYKLYMPKSKVRIPMFLYFLLMFFSSRIMFTSLVITG